MSSYPSISKGLGKLTPELWSRLMSMLEWFEVNKSTIEASKQPGHTKKYFLAKITAGTLINEEDNRYTYTWTEVVLDADNGFVTRTDGLVGDSALNLCEAANTAENVAPGVDVIGDTYPTGFDMMPIGECADGTTVETVVVMFFVRDSDGTLRAVFNLANAHDGTSCVDE